MIINLKREDWDFSSLQSEELLPALRWEIRRECADIEQDIVNARALGLPAYERHSHQHEHGHRQFFSRPSGGGGSEGRRGAERPPGNFGHP